MVTSMHAQQKQIIQKLIAATRFLLFREKNPKHRVAENLHPLHAVAVFYFLWIVPTVIFNYFMRIGFIEMCIAECILVLCVLEAMHIIFDR